MKTVGGAHNTLYRVTGGRFGGRVQGMQVLLLTTKGRRSGKRRTSPLLFLREGEAMVVVASNGGSSYTPAWWLNLQTNPDAEVEIGRRRTPVTGRRASADERATLWPELTSRYSGYAQYVTRTDREIPVVILEPR
jgi:F420H(2)-dependent quinone reductase